MKKKIIIIVVIIIVILIILFSIKFYKINKIINLIEENNKKLNYSYIDEDILENNFSRLFKHKGNILINITCEDVNDYIYYDLKSKIVYNIDNENKVYYKRTIDINDELKFPFYEFLTSDHSLKNKLKLVFEWKLTNYDNDRYEITTKDNYKIIFDKNTGIALRVTNMNPDKRTDKVVKDFEYNSVTDDDVKLPDLSEYKEIEKN